MLNNDQIKKLVMDCESRNPEGLYPVDLDVLEYTEKVSAIVREQEHARCCEIVRNLNTEVAKVLERMK